MAASKQSCRPRGLKAKGVADSRLCLEGSLMELENIVIAPKRGNFSPTLLDQQPRSK